MNRKAWIIAIGLLTCGGTAVWLRLAWTALPVAERAAFHVVIDTTSQPVRVPVRPRHVLSLCTSATDTMIRLGAAKRLAAIDEYGRIVPGTESAAIIGTGSAISREQVIALAIDLAFVWWYQDDTAQTLEELGVPVIRIRSGRAAELPAMIRLVGEALAEPRAAESLADKVSTYLTRPQERNGYRPHVYLELYGPYKTVGRDSYVNDLLELAGGENVAEDATGSVLLSAEKLIQANPEVILFVDEFTSAEAISGRSGLAACSAVQAGRIRPLRRYWLVAGARLPDAVENLRSAMSRAGG